MKSMKPLAILTAALLSGIAPNLHAAELQATDGAASDGFGGSVSLSGNSGIMGGTSPAYLFRSIPFGSGTLNEDAKLIADDGSASDNFGFAASVSGTIGVVGAFGNNSGQGSAYVFRNLDSAAGSVTQDAKLVAGDGSTFDRLGSSVSLSGTAALIGAPADDIASNTDQGSAYVFRNLDTATGQVIHSIKLTASDGAGDDQFGNAVSLSGTIGVVGAIYDDFANNGNRGSAYVFRALDTATGTITENAKLISSDGQSGDNFGVAVATSGNMGLVGAQYVDAATSNSGAAYVFRNLDSANGTVTENLKLIASDAASSDFFGSSVSLSGNTGLVGVGYDDVGSNINQGSAYLYRSLDSGSGTVVEDVKLTASDGAAYDNFGWSVGIDGDNFVVGSRFGDGVVADSGKGYTGSVSSVTTLDAGNTSRTISGISFVSQDDWIIGQTTDSNQVTLSAGDTANVTALGKAVYIGKDAGSDNNTLLINGSLIANQIYVGATSNSGNELIIGETGMVNGNIIFAGGTTVGGDGTITGDLTLGADSKFIFSLTNTLTVTGSVSLDSTFGIDDLIGLDSSVSLGTYTLINGTATDFSSLGIENWGSGNAYVLGGGKSAYFKQGSLQVEVVPEPGTLSLLALGLMPFLRRRRVTRA